MGGKKNAHVKSWQLNRAFYHCNYCEMRKGLKVCEITAEADKSVTDYKMKGESKKQADTIAPNHLARWLLLFRLIDYKSV